MSQQFNKHIFVSTIVAALLASVCGHDFGTVKSVTDWYHTARAELSKADGVFIRTAYNHGCLDSGCCNLRFRQVYYSENCPLWTWFRWSFQGPILVAHKLLMTMCLDCRDGRPDCMVGTAHCTGSHSQKWDLGFQLNATTAHGDLLFSIHNHLFPHQCATVDTGSNDGLVLRDCADPPIEEQLFYVDRDWMQTAVSAQQLVDVRQSHFGNSSRSSALQP